jgi:selenocysteine lyase/cysteine desulfurase
LKQDGIITSNRDDNLRLSPHIYNNLEDIERLMDGLDKHSELLL